MEIISSGGVYSRFCETAERYPERPFLNVLDETARIYAIPAGEITYADMARRVEERRRAYRDAGYGAGHRIGLLVENRPSFFEHWFALNGLGASVVPINPELRAAELSYLIAHSEQCLAVAIESRQQDLRAAGGDGEGGFTVIGPDDAPPPATRPTTPWEGAECDAEAALLYTSGTTGLPKGCVLTNVYFLSSGWRYRGWGGYCALSEDGERMITPLPLFHMNAMACSAMGMLYVGGCLTVLDRFHPRSWWDSVRQARATIVHYLGVMPAMLMGAEVNPDDRRHTVRFGFGAGVGALLHAPFEERFGFPLVEAWGMTETGNCGAIVASHDPRHVGENCFGKAGETVQARIIDDAGADVAVGEPGELLVRSAAPGDPRYGFFNRYLKNEEATAEAWADGWFHTGDLVSQNPDGTFRFVDRKKNVIRRSGENISAVEVESIMAKHEAIDTVAVAATPDEVRGDEVFTCVVLTKSHAPRAGDDLARSIVGWCLGQMAYYKAPGYIAFVESLPLTSTNKIKRGELRDVVADLKQTGRYIDVRHLKKRSAA